MVYNYCYMVYKNDESDDPKFEFNIADYSVNFKSMTEEVGGVVRDIRKADDSHIRIRQESSDRIKGNTT